MKSTSLHPALPQTMTPENLAQWITENKADTFEHEEKVDLSPETKSELEHKASLAACKIKELEDCKKEFMEYLKKGTPVDPAKTAEDNNGKLPRLPQEIQIPPTAGLDELNKNLTFFTKQLRNGFTSVSTMIFLIPFPEGKVMIAVDIEGNEWTQYNRDMTEPEKVNYDRPILAEVEAGKKGKKGKKDGNEIFI